MFNTKNMTKQSSVESQYSDDSKLNIRKSLHYKYSTNKHGFSTWLFSQYDFKDGYKVLELGSGNGDIWETHIVELCNNIDITLSDFSKGMIDILENKYNNLNVQIKRIDIQDIPFEDESFDIVIANAMLYHVPDIDKAIAEVHRVLKSGGAFYASTFGEFGLTNYINECMKVLSLKTDKTMNLNFTLQNGRAILEKKFDIIERVDYIDSLEISDVMDFVEYIYSMTSLTGLDENKRNELITLLETKRNEFGLIFVPKEYGTFVSYRV